VVVTFTNNYKNILDKLESILETEFKGAVPVYKGDSIPKGVNKAIQIIPSGSVLSEYDITSEIREFSVTLRFIFAEVNVNETALDHILRHVSRIEALIHDNVTLTLSDDSVAFNCRIQSTELSVDEENIYVVNLEWQCLHRANLT